MLTLTAMLVGSAKSNGSQLAIVEGERSLTTRSWSIAPPRWRATCHGVLEIEEQLERHAAVEVAQVVGVPVAGKGDVPVAYVKLRSGAAASPQELAIFCGERLASYKAPRLVRLVDEFPFVDGPNLRKIQKGQLRERAAADLAGAG